MVTKAGIIFLLFVGALYTTDAQITGWTTPTITGADGTGTLEFPEDQETGETGTTFAATSTSGTISSYTLSPATGTPFSVASTTGVLSLDSALDFETTSSYTLEITASDGSNEGTATITVTVTDVDETDPVFSPASYSACIADKSLAGTTLTTVTATVKDTSQTITYAISSGDDENHFKIGTNDGIILVNDDKTLDKATTDAYELVVTATVAPDRTGTTKVSVTVADSCNSGSAVAVVSMMMLIVSLCMTLF